MATKPNKRAFDVQFLVHAWVAVEIEACSLEQALQLGNELTAERFMDDDITVCDSRIVQQGVFDKSKMEGL